MEFTKLQGMGNDFLVVLVDDARHAVEATNLAITMCDRHFGAGADGLILASRNRSQDSDFDSRIFNADGGEAEVSGTGPDALPPIFTIRGCGAVQN